MFSLEIVLLGLALAIDAAVVTFAFSLLHQDHAVSVRTRNAFFVSGCFGFFQFLMLWLGSHAGYLITFSQVGIYFRLSIGLIFFVLAGKCLVESLRFEERTVEWGLWPLFALSILTSIDALAAGVSLGTVPQAYLASFEVGTITFGVCLSFYFLGQFLDRIPSRWLLRIAGGLFLFLGGHTLWTLKDSLIRG